MPASIGHAAIELYAEVFDDANALDKLEAFASFHGPDFYNLPRNTDTITLLRESWTVPDELDFGGVPGVGLRAGETIAWRLQSPDSRAEPIAHLLPCKWLHQQGRKTLLRCLPELLSPSRNSALGWRGWSR